MASYMRKTNLIEGIGDELIVALAAFLGILIPMVIFVSRRRNNSEQYVTHPDNEDNVRSARERIHGNQNGAGPSVGDENRSNAYRAREAHSHGQTNLSCPICLGEMEYGVDTNCGHYFCGNCIIAYWQHGSWLGAVACPVCRQQVTLLLVAFSPEEMNNNSEEKANIMREINSYNRRFSGQPRSIGEHLRDLPTLMRHFVGEFFTVGGLIWMFRLRVIVCFLAALLYFISPLDIIPEAMFGLFGFLDDLFILLLLAIYISIIYRQVVQNRAGAH
ncbi:E3 ubiquitin-protein ligase RNF170-like [Mizuhopecten yessoensis]|uniref:E3 ubiquitin-protein ligase RNF170 n=1 Tax=Mizuhopecten yessoensis TaxID=6573 RepID=A0A210QF98_MIZYE|nr:E3 ubiquitin-protein ligase RNF170-like [Mizuhopecten yessoensis]XP_021359580.1 E3 ubiquitin-protein ligase RNF170-like [Mizuhopecten yessoensis]OWF47379.1 E5 ubiquitin-protein ligase [Mizuhopecten yessoensis]